MVRGDVVPDDDASAAAAWAARSDYLRRLARLNTDELAGLPLAEREARWAACSAGTDGGAGGLLDRATGCGRGRSPSGPPGPDTASRRLQYVRTPDGWTCRPLPG